MAVSTVYIGRHQTGAPDPDFGVVGSGQKRASVYNKTSQHLWLTRLGARLGAYPSATATTYYLSAYLAGTSAHVPDALLARTDQQTVSTAMTTWDTGTVVEHDLSGAAVRVFAGYYVALAISANSGSLGHGMIAASKIGADEERFFDASDAGAPDDPFGSYTGSVEGHLTLWAVCHANVAPETPTSLSPSGSINTLTPTLTATFRDQNGRYGPGHGGYDDGDVLDRYQIQVRRQADGVLVWQPATFDATGAEQAADQSSQTYAGSALARGTTYEWRVRHSDQMGDWSAWSAWTAFTPANLGFVTLAGTPNGKQETVTPGPFQFTWDHNGGLSTNGVEIRLKRDGTVVQSSPTFLTTVAAGASGSLTWAQTTFSSLAWGKTYVYEIRGRDTNNVWSAWSTGRSFSTDAAPTVPANLSPSGDATSASLPKLTATWTDSDDDTATGLTGTFEITRPDLTTATVTPTYNGTTAKWEFQTTTTELNQFGAYSWRARSFDGTLYSGGTTSSGSATWSSPATFTYATGPTVAMTSPADGATITTATPTITWTASAQASYRVHIHATDAAATRLYDSGLQVDAAARSFTYPSGYIANGDVVTLEVTVFDSNNLSGVGQSTVTLAYTPPDSITGFEAVPVAVGTDPWPTAVRLAWDQTSDPDFLYYIIRRSDLTRAYARVTSPSQTSLIDYLPTSGTEFVWNIRQVVQRETEELSSDAVKAAATVDLQGVVVCSVTNPEAHRAVLAFASERSHVRTGNEALYLPWNATEPTTVRGQVRYWTTPGRYTLVNDERATALQRLAEVEDLDAYGGILCYRDERGRKRFVVTPRGGLTVRDTFPQQAEVEWTFREEAFEEGVL